MHVLWCVRAQAHAGMRDCKRGRSIFCNARPACMHECQLRTVHACMRVGACVPNRPREASMQTQVIRRSETRRTPTGLRSESQECCWLKRRCSGLLECNSAICVRPCIHACVLGCMHACEEIGVDRRARHSRGRRACMHECQCVNARMDARRRECTIQCLSASA